MPALALALPYLAQKIFGTGGGGGGAAPANAVTTDTITDYVTTDTITDYVTTD